MIDTLATARSLEEAGMDAGPAAAVTDAIRRAVTEGSATKADLAGLETRISADIAEFRAEVRADNAEFRAEVRADNAELKTELRADNAEAVARIQADNAELKTKILDDTVRFKAEVHAELSTFTWRILGGVGLLLAIFTAIDRLLG